MKTVIQTLLFVAILSVSMSSCKDNEEDPETSSTREIWSGNTLVFSKTDGADWTVASNQDRITDKVWITRANNKGIFNIAQESSYQGEDVYGNSPMGTEWAFGTTDRLPFLRFTTWAQAHRGYPPELVGRNMVLHLISDDIYIDITFTSWSNGDSGGQGGFAYNRSTK